MTELFSVEGTLDDQSETPSGLESLESFITEGNFGATRSYEPPPPAKGRLGEIPTRPNSEPSRFSIGIPIIHPEYINPWDEKIPPSISHQLRGFEFYWVQLACSFSPGRGHTFESARFQVSLLTEAADPTSTLHLTSPAMAYSLYPDRIEDKYEQTRKISLTPELKFFAFEGSIPGYEHTMSGATYKVRVESFGLQDTLAGWTFARGSHALSGTNSLFLLLRKPKQTQVKAIFNLSASVRTQGGPLKFLTMKYRRSASGELVETPSYPLC